MIILDRNPVHPQGAVWAETQGQFILPEKTLSGLSWMAGKQVSFGLIAGGQDSITRLPFTVTAAMV